MTAYGNRVVLAREGRGGPAGRGPVALPVVVVSGYTQPGCSVRVNLPSDGVMSGCRTNHCDGLSLAKLKLLGRHMCAMSPARLFPPVTVKLACCAAHGSEGQRIGRLGFLAAPGT